MIKISDGVFLLNQDYSVLNEDLIKSIKKDCLSNEKKRSRINFHRSSDELVQEMIIAMHKNTDIDVHAHKNKSESFHIIEGRICIVLFEGETNVEMDRIYLSSKGYQNYYRMNSEIFHLVVPLSEITIIHETTQGPFQTNSAIYPEWALTKAGKELIKSLKSEILKGEENQK